MCGICGIVDLRGRKGLDQSLLRRMTHTLDHRGPDDFGVFVTPEAGLGHTRLSIIDLSSAGHQPMFSEDQKIAMVFNGEVYNFQELRPLLVDAGYQFFSNTDSEVVLRAYQHWGVDAFDRFKGMFALAIWDAEKRQLHLARDMFGIKPLYFHVFSGGIVFGSEVKALLASGCLPGNVNSDVLHEYLYYGTALGEHSMHAGVKKLLPGHRLSFDENGFKIVPYASGFDDSHKGMSDQEIVAHTATLLDRAVKRHLISDVPVGIFLSGGIDSSSLAALASRHYEGRLKTYSVGFDYEKGVNELDKARLVAEHFHTEHHEVMVKGSNIEEVIESLVRSHDEPFGDAADIPLYLLCRQLRGEIKVVLQGDGGDEIFAGYRRYNILSAARTWRLLASVAGPLLSLAPKRPQTIRLKRFLQAVGQSDPAVRMALLMTVESLDNPPTRVLSPQHGRHILEQDPFNRYREMNEIYGDQDPVQRMLYTDCKIILPDIFLEKVDKSTMAHGMEIRVPLLDADLGRFVGGLPSHYKVRRGQKKWLIRKAMRGVVPDAILDGPKTGFGVPFHYWLREPLADYMKGVLLDPGFLSWQIFDRDRLERCITEHISGARNNGFLLYKLLQLALWYRFYVLESNQFTDSAPAKKGVII